MRFTFQENGLDFLPQYVKCHACSSETTNGIQVHVHKFRELSAKATMFNDVTEKLFLPSQDKVRDDSSLEI